MSEWRALGLVACALAFALSPLAHGCTDWDELSRDYDPDRACATYVVAGDVHSCARTAAGALFCWGDNRFGQLGVTGASGPGQIVRVRAGEGRSALRVYVPTGNGDLTADLTGFSCAVMDDEKLYCWGDNRFGQLGTGDTVASAAPRVVEEFDGAVSRVTNGAGHTCLQTLGGDLFCFGRNVYGQLGTGDVAARLRPTRVDIGRKVERLAAGGDFTCGRGTDARLFCWGANAAGQWDPLESTCRHASLSIL